MKTKICLSVIFTILCFYSKGQQVLITPNSEDNLQIGDAPFPSTFQKGITINNSTDYLQSRITLIDNSDGGVVNSYIDSRYSPSPALSAMQIGVSSNHPINFFSSGIFIAKFNKYGSFGVGVPQGGYADKDMLKAKIEGLGVGDSSATYSYFYPFKVSVLGQTANISGNFNSAGLMGVASGGGAPNLYSIGVMAIPILDPSAGVTNRSYFGTYNSTIVSNAIAPLYGSYNNVLNQYSSNSTGTYGNYTSSVNAGTGTAYGTFNYSESRVGNSFGVYNDVDANEPGSNAYGVYNYLDPDAGPGYGIYNAMDGEGGTRTGVYNDLTYSTNGFSEYGVYNNITGSGDDSKFGTYTTVSRTRGYSSGSYNTLYGSGSNPVTLTAVFGEANNLSTNISSGSYGGAFHASGSAGSVYGLYSSASGSTSGQKFAGYFSGNVHVSGTLSKSSGSFKIDHPQDPENKYLYHSFVESPDMMNVYNGNVTTNADGVAEVTLPGYFEALNKDYRYQLTVLGQFAQAIIQEKVLNNKFKIKTDKPNVEVSWQVTGIRQDAYANSNRIPTEVDKPKEEVGTYLNPEAFGKSLTKGLEHSIENKIESAQVSISNSGQQMPVQTGERDTLKDRQRATLWDNTKVPSLPLENGSLDIPNPKK